MPGVFLSRIAGTPAITRTLWWAGSQKRSLESSLLLLCSKTSRDSSRRRMDFTSSNCSIRWLRRLPHPRPKSKRGELRRPATSKTCCRRRRTGLGPRIARTDTLSIWSSRRAPRSVDICRYTPTLADALAGLPEPAAEAPGILTTITRLVSAASIWSEPSTGSWSDHAGPAGGTATRKLSATRVPSSMDGTPTDRRGGAPAGLRRSRPDEPCKAITGAARAEFLHPSADRYLSLRECARFKPFPTIQIRRDPIGTSTINWKRGLARLARILANSEAQLEQATPNDGEKDDS